MTNTANEVMGWDDEISAEFEWTPLPEGEYDFEVVGFERGRYEPKPGAKLPACPMAKLKLLLHGDTGTREIQHNFFLHRSMEGQMSAFFICIDQKKKGETLSPNWQMIVGAKGRAKVGINKYTGNDGNEYTNNQVTRFLEPSENKWTNGGAF